jgi:FKBP-type peptidyl-prolyl cis-trans isomerase FklB
MECIEMKQLLAALVCLGLLVHVGKAEEKQALKDPNDRASYSVGYQIGTDFKLQGVGVSPELNKEPLMTPEEMQQTLVQLKQKIMAARKEEQKKAAAENLAQGEAFLAENSKKEGVKTLPSGLQYKVIEEGTGKTPKADNFVTVQYRGTLIDGSDFDSSYARKEPAKFQVNRVIPGWKEALEMMKEGAKWEIFVPARLAYGERGVGSLIPPNSALIFYVELVSVDEKPKADKDN